MPQVVLEVDLVSDLEGGAQTTRPHAAQPVIERGRGDRETAQVFVDLARVIARRASRQHESLQTGDMHRRLARFHEHEAQVEQVEQFAVGHGILRSPAI
ncbi:MAG: hypothetical protein IPF84_16750 [Proteobacteria bacterium]|nr:hypothetical protein [Pseudomonadota bacterium]